METVNVNGAPVIILAQPAVLTTNPIVGQDLRKKMVILGSSQIVFGGLMILYGIITLAASSIQPRFNFGDFAAVILFIATGATGCAAGKLNRRRLMTAFNVLSIISASVIVSLLGIGFLIGIFYVALHSKSNNAGGLKDPDEEVQQTDYRGVILSLLVVALAVGEAIAAIWSSVVCRKAGVCCCDCCNSCCPPMTPVPTQGLLMMQNGGGGQQRTVSMYSASSAQPLVAADFQESKNPPPYQQSYDEPYKSPV